MDDDRRERRRERREDKRERRGDWGDWIDDKIDQVMERRSDAITPGMSEAEIEQRLRLRIERRRKKQREFIMHLISYIAVNAIVWVIYGTSVASGGSVGFPWPLAVTLGWGIGLVANGLEVYQSSGKAIARREEAVRREVEMEKMRMGLASDDYEKPKRSLQEDRPTSSSMSSPPSQKAKADNRPMRLSDDGELVPVDEDSDDAEQPPLLRRSGVE